MMEIFGQTSISEVILLFVLLFAVPLMAVLLRRLRNCEKQLGEGRGGKKKKKKSKDTVARTDASGKPSVPPDVFPYREKVFLTPPERACLEALNETFGREVRIYAKVALWELAESTDKNPGFSERLADKSVEFLICDAATGKPFTAVCFEQDAGGPQGRNDDLRMICKAIGLHLVFLPQADEYDAAALREQLNIPDAPV